MQILKNLSKAEVVAKYEEIEKEARQFEVDHASDTQAINAVFVAWFGFTLTKQKHPYLSDFNIDERIWPPFFHLTHSGEPVASG